MTRPQFACAVHKRAGEITIAVCGEFDVDTIDDFRAVAVDALADLLVTTVRVDCAGLSFIDCAALGALVRIRNEADAARKTLVLERPSAALKRLLDISGINIPIVVDRWHAVG